MRKSLLARGALDDDCIMISCMRACVCVRARARVCVCVGGGGVRVCVCVCVCARALAVRVCMGGGGGSTRSIPRVDIDRCVAHHQHLACLLQRTHKRRFSERRIRRTNLLSNHCGVVALNERKRADPQCRFVELCAVSSNKYRVAQRALVSKHASSRLP
jgi:hypothetical protein